MEFRGSRDTDCPPTRGRGKKGPRTPFLVSVDICHRDKSSSSPDDNVIHSCVYARPQVKERKVEEVKEKEEEEEAEEAHGDAGVLVRNWTDDQG